MLLKLFNIKWAGDLTWTDHDCVEPNLPKEIMLRIPDVVRGNGNSQTNRLKSNFQELILKVIDDFEESINWVMDDYEFTFECHACDKNRTYAGGVSDGQS